MRCPASDPGFADNPVHGRSAQLPEIARVVKMCGNRKLAIDAGAHIGIWSVELSKHFDIVHAFEPVPENYDCLLENVARCRVVAHPGVALGEHDGFCEMALPGAGNSGMAFVVQDLYATGGRISSAVMHTIDSYQFRDVGLIKIDVEGFEGSVLLGAFCTIEESQPVIVFEDNGLGPKRYGKEHIEPKQLLIKHGYKRAVRIRKDEVWIPSR